VLGIVEISRNTIRKAQVTKNPDSVISVAEVNITEVKDPA